VKPPLHAARGRGIDADVRHGRSLNSEKHLGRAGVLIDDEGDKVLIALKHTNGEMLAALLDDDAFDRFCAVFAEMIEQRNARSRPVNDR
jgi:hypothetical protein